MTTNFRKNLFLLKIYYSKILEILDAFAGGPIAIIDDTLNHYYVNLADLINEILEEKGFERIKKDKPVLFDNLVGNIEHYDIEWRYYSKNAHNFRGEIEKLYTSSGAPAFDLPNELKNFLQKVDEVIDKHKKTRNERWRQMLNRTKEKQSKQKKISLNSQKIDFDDDKAIIHIGEHPVPLPPYKNDHYFFRAIWEYRVNEPVDWSVLYEKITGYYEAYYGKPPEVRENWRLVYDAMRSVNSRIHEVVNTNDDLFTWQEKTVTRNR